METRTVFSHVRRLFSDTHADHKDIHIAVSLCQHGVISRWHMEWMRPPGRSRNQVATPGCQGC